MSYDSGIHRLVLGRVGDEHQARCKCGHWLSHRYNDLAFAEHQHRHHVWHETRSDAERRYAIDRAELELRRQP